MQFELNDAQRALRARCRAIGKRLAARARDLEREGGFPADVFRELAAEGLLTLCAPRDDGGTRVDTVSYSLAVREIAYAEPAVAVAMSVTNMVGETLGKFGTPAQKARHIPAIARGGTLAGAFALTESGAGSDPAAVRTRAEARDGGYVLNGEKIFITSGDRAGVVVVFATSDPALGSRGLSAYLVEPGDPGFSVAKREHKMGLSASSTVSLAFEDCRIPADRLLGKPGEGFRIAMGALDSGRIGIASQALGIAERAYDAALSLVATGSRDGRPLSENQSMQFRLADMRCLLSASELMIFRAAARKEAGLPVPLEAAMAKLFATERANEVVSIALDMHGIDGVVEPAAVEKCLRDARVTTIYEGTSQIQRIVIARQLLKGFAAAAPGA